MIKILDSGRALQNDDIARLEATLGRPLPEQYRAFLLAHNGGRPTPNLVDIEEAHFKGSDIHTIHGIHAADDANDIFWNLETLEGSGSDPEAAGVTAKAAPAGPAAAP